ncbi:MAG: GNAT family N-acetyltransferase [Pseudomonadales bacterium]|nr:GNAT family N-acetyltransferase [Pseudomonadales bacterium]
MIKLRESIDSEIALFVEMEQSTEAAEFIIPYSLTQHLDARQKPEVDYLSILSDGLLAGFIILAIDNVLRSVEFRRIVVATQGQGIGQSAIQAMEAYSVEKLGCERIWLDVFAHNKRGRHIYEKLGYQQFKTAEYQGAELLYLEKKLSP